MSEPPRLWAVTPPIGAPSPSVIDAWCEGGTDVGLWLRTPGATASATVARFESLLARARGRGLAVVVGTGVADLDDAVAVVRDQGLAGVVLRGDPDAAALGAARARLGTPPWVARSIHGPADDHGLCTFSVLGPIHAPHTPKPSPSPALGTAMLAQCAAAEGARIVAIGGVDAGTALACVRAGAWGLAGIRSFFGAPARIVEDVAGLRAALQSAKHGQTSS